MLHLYGTREDTKIRAKRCLIQAQIAANNPKIPEKPIFLPISDARQHRFYLLNSEDTQTMNT